MSFNIRAMLEGMLKVGASDLHLKVGQQPILRLHGVLRPVEHDRLSPEETEEANAVLMPERCAAVLEEHGSVDFSYGLGPLQRFRINSYRQRGTISLAIRAIPSAIPTFEDLNLPLVLNSFVKFRRGMVLVTGMTGVGKSSTLSAMITAINRSRREHIITIEDPIEFVHEDEMSVVEQIEIGIDASGFQRAMKSALRQDPDIILLGELRDRETVESAMHCVETGHLVLSTLHTTDAKQTILRLLHFFPKEDHALIIERMALNLKAVICQRLLKRADGKGLVPCCEVFVSTPMVQKLIREERYDDIDDVMVKGEEGMKTFDMHLVELVKSGTVTQEEASTAVLDEQAFKRMLKGRAAGADRGGLIG